jgi:RNA polymerase sigma-70 factor (ECF subfamily)
MAEQVSNSKVSWTITMAPTGKKQRPMNLESTISNVLAGDAAATPAIAMQNDAFAAFYERSARPLWAYLARVSGDAALADDLLQESYVRFLCADTQSLDGEVAARKYLFRIATNLMKDYWRKPRTASMDDVPEEHFQANGTSGQVESQMMLGPALKQMRPRERQLLWLAYAEGYSHREIAQVTGLASASIRLLLFRARRKVARLITDRATEQSTGRAE